MSEYDKVILSSLKLKSSGKISKKKKKKKSKKEEVKRLARSDDVTAASRDAGTLQVHSGISKNRDSAGGDSREQCPVYKDNRTRAEIAFEERREQKQMDRLLNKAEKSHKERIMDLNDHLANLSEHFDIQKVSWTK